MTNIEQRLVQRTENRPNVLFANGKAAYVTIHETGNTAPTADAEAHASYMYQGCPDASGNPTQKSWHFTVDQTEIFQSLQTEEQGWHAGDGGGPGNTTSIGIELCVNDGSDFSKTRDHAAELVAELNEQGHGFMGTVPHQFWSGKNCPTRILEGDLWDDFLKRVANFQALSEGDQDVWIPPTGVIGGGVRAEAAPPIERPTPPPPPPRPILTSNVTGVTPTPTTQPQAGSVSLVQGTRTIKKAIPEIGATGGTGGIMALINSLGVNIDIEVLIAVMVAVPPLLFAARRLLRDALGTIKELKSVFINNNQFGK